MKLILILSFCLFGAMGQESVLLEGETKNMQCGGTIQSDTGSLTFPEEGQTINAGEVCVWTIHLDTTLNFRMEFSQFGASANATDCTNAGVRIYSLSNLVTADRDYYTFCDESPPPSFIFVGQTVATVVFYTSADTAINTETGFVLHWEGSSVDPSGPHHLSSYLTTDSARVQYPIVGNYENHLIATWLINADTLYSAPVNINITRIKLDNCTNTVDTCLCDALILYEISEVGVLTERERFCQDVDFMVPISLVSKNFILGFFTDLTLEPNQNTGFNLVYYPDPDYGSTTTEYPFPISTQCGEETLIGPEGKISYKMNNFYSDYERCIWTIRLPPTANQMTFILTSASFPLGDDRDALFISTYTLLLDESGSGVTEVQEKYIMNEWNQTITLNGSIALVLFGSDEYDSDYGFELEWSSTFVGSITNVSTSSQDFFLSGNNGTFIYPFDGATYDNLELSTFVVPYPNNRQSSGHWLKVIIQTEDGGIEESCYDSIKIYRFLYYTSGLDYYTKLCQENLGTGVTVFEGDSLIVIFFISDGSNVGKGFSIDWEWESRKPNLNDEKMIEDKGCATSSCN